jgi:hypothetical protein
MVEATRLSGRYVLGEQIARGGMGAVYRARDVTLERVVAIKLLGEHVADDPRFVERFRREARAAAALTHPNIASVYDYGEEGERAYIVMELVEGDDLAAILSAGRLALSRARHIAAQACDALGHAHRAGLVHRDVKPANVIVGRDDHVKVTDFGIARAAGDTTLTAVGSVLGTAAYMSPEQASGAEVGPSSDVYSMGIVLYEMLTGAPPFDADTPVALALKHVSEDVPAPSVRSPEVPDELDRVVERATNRRPELRYPNGTEMAGALRSSKRATAPLPAAAPAAVESPVATPRPPRGRPVLAQLIAVATVVAFLLAAVAVALTLTDASSRGEGGRAPGAQGRNGNGRDEPTNEPEQPPETVVVPDGLVGSNSDDASAVLSEAGLVPEIQEITHDEVPSGLIIETKPAEGTDVKPGSVVTLVVSTGRSQPPPEEGDEGDEGQGEGQGHGEGSSGPGRGEGPKDKGKDE